VGAGIFWLGKKLQSIDDRFEVASERFDRMEAAEKDRFKAIEMKIENLPCKGVCKYGGERPESSD
jgi:hypothetical protein